MARRKPPSRSITTGSKKGLKASLKDWTPVRDCSRGIRSEVATRGMASVVHNPAATLRTNRAYLSARPRTPWVQ